MILYYIMNKYVLTRYHELNQTEHHTNHDLAPDKHIYELAGH